MSLLKRGTIKSYDPAAHRASVQIAGSLGVWLDALPVATDIAPAEVVAGRECAVLFFTDDNPADAVIITVHGAVPAPVAGGIPDKIRDADQDTRAEVEASADEDKFRLTIAGTLRYLAQAATPHHQFTGNVRVSSGVLGINVDPVTDIFTLIHRNANSVGATGLHIEFGTTSPSGHATNQLIGVSGRAWANAAGLDTVYGLNFETGLANHPGPSVTEVAGVRAGLLFLNASGVTLSDCYLFTTYVNPLFNLPTITRMWGLRLDELTIGGQRRPIQEEGTSSQETNADGNRLYSNTQFGSLTGSFGGGKGVIGIANARYEPDSAPSGGGVLYASAGQLRWLDSAGRNYQISPETIDRTLANGANNNVDPGNALIVRITGPTAAFSISGVTGGYTGRLLILYNTTGQQMSIVHESAGSLASARIRTMNGATWSTTGEGLVLLIYSGADSRWLMINMAA